MLSGKEDRFEPKTYKEAVNCAEKDQWTKAMEKELKSIEANQTWTLVDVPSNRKIIGSKWVFKLKCDENGNVVKYKARVVAQGFTQVYGQDYDEVFAPAARAATLRLLLSVAGRNKYTVKHYDVKAAFLNGNLDEEIYMKAPFGYAIENKV
jgi:Reverse transcriptase (RNA-dependent DNA polymerase)